MQGAAFRGCSQTRWSTRAGPQLRGRTHPRTRVPGRLVHPVHGQLVRRAVHWCGWPVPQHRLQRSICLECLGKQRMATRHLPQPRHRRQGTMVGGRWYGGVDEAQSDLLRELVWDDATRNTLQFDDYFRFDLKTNLTWNCPSTTHELGIDWVNVLGTENVLKLTYAPDDASESSVREEYQLGFLAHLLLPGRFLTTNSTRLQPREQQSFACCNLREHAAPHRAACPTKPQTDSHDSHPLSSS